MYRTNNFGWKLTHVLCILAHLGLAAAGAIAYVYNNVGRESRLLDWSRMAMTMNMNTNDAAPHAAPCPHVDFQRMLTASLGITNTLDVALQTLPKSSLVLGLLGLVTNIGLFVLLLGVERVNTKLTEGEQHWRKQVVTFFSCISNLLLAGAGVALAGAMGMKLPGSKSLITPLVWVSIQIPLALITALFDTIKNHRDGKDLLD
ncbi:hypothetical protein OQA88_12433 [Cercophora sp. LCS_1]